jgi:D-alanyl-D-alanine carboxypeptidase/D-alanyl-D-alanine-endopeptidase (penicillin-binding protein 4)
MNTRAARRPALLAPLAALFALALALAFALAAPAPARAGGGLAERLQAILADPGLAGAEIGAAVLDLETGETVFEREAARPLSLASNQKLVTTACALDRLGADHRFETVLLRRGLIAGDTLDGDVIVRGGGDPCLGARFDGEADGALRRFARALREAGVRRVSGGVVADDRLFDRELRHPAWPRDQLDRWYEAPVSALVLNDGCVDVTVAPGARPGAAPIVTLAPAAPLFDVELRATTTADRREHVISVERASAGGRDRLIVRGAVLAGAEPIEAVVTVGDPALVFAAVLRERLAGEGIAVEGAARLARPDEDLAAAVPVAVHASLLAQALPVVNKRSQNHYAEMLFKGIAAAEGKGPGSFAGGADAVGRFLLANGIAREEFAIEDGSGLARGNRMAPRALARVLRLMARHREAAVYMASLAVAGAPGTTLHGRLDAPPLRGRVLAKTGTINGVSALSGYVLARPGDFRRGYAFAIVGNHLREGPGRARAAQDACVEALAAALAGPSGSH